MIRLVFMLRRRPGMRFAEFQGYWSQQHAPLVKSVRSDLGILRYTQSYRIHNDFGLAGVTSTFNGVESPYDGVAELWYASEAAMMEAGKTRAGRRAARALLDDERQFIDLPASPIWIAHEYPPLDLSAKIVVAEPTSSIVKFICLFRSIPELGEEGAKHVLLDRDEPVAIRRALLFRQLAYRQVIQFDSPVEAALRKDRGTDSKFYLGHLEAWIDTGRSSENPDINDVSRLPTASTPEVVELNSWFGRERVIVGVRR